MESKFLISEHMINALIGKVNSGSVRATLLKEIIKSTSYIFYSDGKITFNNYIVRRFNVSRPRASQLVKELVEDGILEKISKYIYHIKGLSKHGI